MNLLSAFDFSFAVALNLEKKVKRYMYRLNCEVYKLVVWSFFSVLFSFSGLIYSSSFHFIYMFCKHSSPEKSYMKV